MPRKVRVPVEKRVDVLETRADAQQEVINTHTRQIEVLTATAEKVHAQLTQTDNHVGEAQKEMRDGFSKMNDKVLVMTTSALNSVPQWAALREGRKDALLKTALVILIAVVGWLIHR